MPRSETTPRITLTLRHVRWLDAVDRVFGTANASYAMDAETYANGAQVWVSRTWRRVPLSEAVRDLVHRLPAATRPRLWDEDGVTYLTSRRTADGVELPWVAPPKLAAGRRSYHLTDVPLARAIECVMGATPYAVRLVDRFTTSRVTLHLSSATREEALEAVGRQAKPGLERWLARDGSAAGFWPASIGQPAGQEARVTVVAHDANVRHVLAATFYAARLNYALDPMVQGRVTLVLRDVPLGVAVGAIATISYTGAKYRVENGIWLIAPGPPERP